METLTGFVSALGTCHPPCLPPRFARPRQTFPRSGCPEQSSAPPTRFVMETLTGFVSALGTCHPPCLPPRASRGLAKPSRALAIR
jgi:hypothetical protein